MRKWLFLLICLLCSSNVLAGTIQYVGTGRSNPPAQVTFSRNNGASWQNLEIKPGQAFNVPRDTTHLYINNVPRDPRLNYKIKDGNVF